MHPTDLTCEYQAEPPAIDVPAPRLSWINESDRAGDSQSAYRIVVRTGGTVVWDSGRVETDEHHLVSYAGEPLRSSTRYEWSVRVWDADGTEESESSPAMFETSLMTAEEWNASWITMKTPNSFETLTRRVVGDIISHEEHSDGHYWAIYLHRTFSLAEPAARARMRVCGLGYNQLWVNGRKVGDRHLDPAQTDYDHGALYSTFDVSDYLTAGENGVGIVLGNGRQIKPFGYGQPMAIAELELFGADGEKRVVGTDAKWTACHGPIHENGIYSGEVRDDRDRLDGWSTPSFAAGRGGGAPAIVVQKGPSLRAQQLPPVRVVKSVRASRITSPEPGVHIYDFGVNMSGIVRVQARGESGRTITIRYSELLDEGGRLHLGTNREATASDTWILRGEGRESYEPTFTYHGFRYAEVTGYPGIPDESAVVALETHTDVQSAGSFRCSNELVNRIHEAVLRGQLANLVSVPTDCPQRGERMGWLGDAQLTCEEAMYNFDMAAFYTKYLEDIRYSLRDDGALSDVTPPYWPLYPADPAWGTAYATIVWNLYRYYGDRSILERHYESLRRYTDFLEGVSERQIVTIGKYGDWCPPASTYPKRTPIALTSTFYYYHDTRIVAQIAELLGRTEDAHVYGERSRLIAEAFDREFNEHGRYAVTSMSPIDRHGSQTSQLLPLALDLVPEQDRDECIGILMREVVERFDYHPDTGIVGWRYLLDVLSQTGHPDAAWRVITQTSYPSLGYMIGQGATTLWERWENLSGVGMNSHNHIMFGSVDTWFYSTLCGIRMVQAAWKRIRIAPWFPSSLTHAAATLRTVQGTIGVSWRRDGNSVALTLQVPVGVEADLELPENGVTTLGDGNEAPATVGSGTHELLWVAGGT